MDETKMDHHHHHHHHHHHEMTPSSTDSNPDSTSLVNGLLTSHQHHHDHHHDNHMNTFHIWAASKLLVQSWSLDSPLGLVMAILFSTFLSVVYEGSKFYYHIGKILVIRNIHKRHRPMLYHYISRMWKSLAFMVHFLIGYILMLCAMTFNLWVLAAVCLGSGIGYYFLLPIVQYVIQSDMDARVTASQGTMTRMVLDTSCAQRRRKTGDREDANRFEECASDVLLEEVSEVTDSLQRETVV